MRILLLMIPLLLATALAESAERLPGEVIVRWRTPPPRRVVEEEAARAAPQRPLHVRRVWGQVEVLTLRGATAAQTRAFSARLARRSDVLYTQPNYIRRPLLLPNDEHYPIQWGLPRSKLETAWDITTGSSSVVVAIVDTGIRAHPDLAGRVLAGYDFITTLSFSGDGDGRDPDPTDLGSSEIGGSAQHGTHIAGIIGATSNNQKGVSGVDWACKILPVRALGVDEGRGSDADISAAIRWAAGLKVDGVPDNINPAHIINLSFGGDGRSDILTQAIKEVVAKGVVVVAAAGNDNVDGANTFPAALPDVIDVGAIGYSGERAPYSNFGDALTLVAPGGNLLEFFEFPHQGETLRAGIVSTLFDTTTQTYGYHLYDGTSQAAPLVAGVAALMLAANPDLSAAEVRLVLANTADPVGRCDAGCGAGLVDATAAVKAAVALIPPPPPPPEEGLPFAALCASDDACADKTCRDMGSGPICTLACTVGMTRCPNDSTCERGYCNPSRTPSTNLPGETPELLGGCQVGALPSPWGGIVLLALLLCRRRRVRGPRG
ncbi:MAG: S8 family serine peptidase [Deltaproteobacteria bacterium]|nr:S8 family serine peptidase [Deltaproteobacteria bacterium]